MSQTENKCKNKNNLENKNRIRAKTTFGKQNKIKIEIIFRTKISLVHTHTSEAQMCRKFMTI